MNNLLSKILIVDYGSQLTQLIAKRVRENNIYSEIFPFDYRFSDLDLSAYSGIIFSGGPYSSTDEDAPCIPAILTSLNLPMMGICYGAQRTTVEYAGKVESSKHREFGKTQIQICETHPIFANIPDQSIMWMSHSDHITQPGEGFTVIARTENNVVAALAHQHKPIFLFQFHPEAYHSVFGTQLISNFLDITKAERNWTMEAFLKEEVISIQKKIQDETVVLGLSGGVDSLVTAVLLYQALGKKLSCVFVDHGLLRANEKEQVETYIREHFDFPFFVIDAQETFLGHLKGILDPEEKRKTIGRLFIETFEDFVKNNLPEATYLAQGTIYPDVIESAGNTHGKGEVIKSHHNVGGLPEHLSLKIVEPLRMLFKDEVRKLASILQIPDALVHRHPFPGPGLGIRIIGEIKPEYIHILQQADAIFIEELHKHNLYDSVNQAFCVFIPIRSVGVIGDNRSYDYTIVIRSVNTEDFMTSEFTPFPWEFLGKVSTRITNEVLQVGRVVYDISNKPPATIEWE